MKKLLQILLILTMAIIVSKLTLGQKSSANNAASSAVNVSQPAQPAAPRWLYVVELNLKPGALNDYMAFRTKERIPIDRKAGIKHQEVWTSRIGEGSKFFLVEPMDDLSLFDQAQTRLVKAIGAEAAQALAAKGAQYHGGPARNYLMRTRPDLSWTSQMTAPPKYAIVARVPVARDRRADFENYIKDYYLPAVKKSGALGYAVSNVRYGGNSSEYLTLTFFNSFTDIEKNDPGMRFVLNRIVGAEAAERNQQRLVGVITDGYERNIIQFRPEQSIMP